MPLGCKSAFATKPLKIPEHFLIKYCIIHLLIQSSERERILHEHPFTLQLLQPVNVWQSRQSQRMPILEPMAASDNGLLRIYTTVPQHCLWDREPREMGLAGWLIRCTCGEHSGVTGAGQGQEQCIRTSCWNCGTMADSNLVCGTTSRALLSSISLFISVGV